MQTTARELTGAATDETDADLLRPDANSEGKRRQLGELSNCLARVCEVAEAKVNYPESIRPACRRRDCQFLQYLVVPGQIRVAGFYWSPMYAPKLPESDGTITDGSYRGRCAIIGYQGCTRFMQAWQTITITPERAKPAG